MIFVFGITAFIIVLYLLYPVWLKAMGPGKHTDESETEETGNVSVILLSCNGRLYLKEKIDFLITELSGFNAGELIIIDDGSDDGSKEILEQYRERDRIKIIFNEKREGIPHSMNLGVGLATHNCLVFCDQRQRLSGGIIRRIVEPLKYEHIGAVSGCISYLDKGRTCSYFRKHENFLKSMESQTGSLIGVYGPFYSVKKQCYSPIPGDIILNDLYLSLKILKSKQVKLVEDCRITDDNFSILYDYKRARRYLSGFLQLVKAGSTFSDLTPKHRIMLIWHKYLRLFIPFLILLCYITIGFMIFQGKVYLVLFSVMTLAGFISALPSRNNFMCKMKSLIRINVFYFIALLDVFVNQVLFHNNKKTQRTFHV
jgi:glycosyltransferase involved in cell wall biosynthesis